MPNRLETLKLTAFQCVAVVAMIGFLFPLLSEARTVIRSGDTVSIGQDQLIEGDLYTAGNIVNISGQIEEDLLVAGSEVTVNGEVGADTFILGGNVDVHGTVGDDLRIIGGTVIIAEPVLGDVFVVGGNVKILPSATVTGDVTVIGSIVEVAGSVEGRVMGWMESLRIDNYVGGNVDVTAGTLTLGDGANVAGNLEYVSQNQLVRSQSATVGGEIVRSEPAPEEVQTSMASVLMPLLVLLFSVALWFLLSRRTLQRVVNRALAPGLRPVLVGTLVLLLGPFAVSILLVSMLGLLGGLVLILAYLLFITLAIIALPAVIAQFIYSVTQKSVAPVSLLTLLVGTLLVGLCLIVPFVGPVILIGFFILSFGALVDLLFRANR